MNELYEKFQQFQSRIRRYEETYSLEAISLPRREHNFCLLLSMSHTDRMIAALSRIYPSQETRYAVCPSASNSTDFAVASVLCFSDSNILDKLSTECIRCVDRVMYCNMQCSDPQSLISHVAKLIRDKTRNVVLKIQACPHSLEQNLTTLLGDKSLGITLTPSETKCTHILQAVYVPHTSITHYGLSEKGFALTERLTSVALYKSLEGRLQVAGMQSVPCRAYFKLSEVVDTIFPSLTGTDGRSFSESLRAGIEGAMAVDVGASPGGWTQYLAHSMGYKRVFAVDPGYIEPSVLSLCDSIVHIRKTVQDAAVKAALTEAGASGLKLRMLVCDVNFEPVEAARVLVEFCMSMLDGIESCKLCDGEGRGQAPSSFVVLTFKMMRKPQQRHIDTAEKACCAIFEAVHASLSGREPGKRCDCWQFDTLHLSANSSNERTLIAKLH